MNVNRSFNKPPNNCQGMNVNRSLNKPPNIGHGAFKSAFDLLPTTTSKSVYTPPTKPNLSKVPSNNLLKVQQKPLNNSPVENQLDSWDEDSDDALNKVSITKNTVAADLTYAFVTSKNQSMNNLNPTVSVKENNVKRTIEQPTTKIHKKKKKKVSNRQKQLEIRILQFEVEKANFELKLREQQNQLDLDRKNLQELLQKAREKNEEADRRIAHVQKLDYDYLSRIIDGTPVLQPTEKDTPTLSEKTRKSRKSFTVDEEEKAYSVYEAYRDLHREEPETRWIAKQLQLAGFHKHILTASLKRMLDRDNRMKRLRDRYANRFAQNHVS